MSALREIAAPGFSNLMTEIARSLRVGADQIMPFADFPAMLSAFLEHINTGQTRLLVAGHTAPAVEIAADRAGMRTDEILGASPFVGHHEDVLENLESSDEIVYLANPNWVTGSNYSLKQLRAILEKLDDGMLILDEKLFDFFGISGLSLLERHANLVVIRSLTAGFGINSDDSGLLIGPTCRISGFEDQFDGYRLNSTLMHIAATSLASEEPKTRHLAMVHSESLRLATRLTRQGVQNRLTAADFILLRVADPARVSNFLTRYGAPVENLDGYPGLKGYLKYTIQSPLSNDKLLEAFARMPAAYYHLDNVDRRMVMFHRPENSAGKNNSGLTRARTTAADGTHRTDAVAGRKCLSRTGDNSALREGDYQTVRSDTSTRGGGK